MRILRASTYTISVFAVFYYFILQFKVSHVHLGKIFSHLKTLAEFATVDLACKLPKLDPFDKSIIKFIEEKVNPPKCLLKYPVVFKSGLDFTLIREPNTSEWKDCCYKIIYRSNKTDNKVDDEAM